MRSESQAVRLGRTCARLRQSSRERRRHGASQSGALTGAIVVVFLACSPPAPRAERDGSGAIVQFGPIELPEVRPGDCLQSVENASYVASMAALPCRDLHTTQAYAVFDIERSGDYPGARIEDLASEGCLASWQDAIGTAYADDTELELQYLSPSRDGWEDGDRSVICLIERLDGSPMVGSRVNS